MGRIIEPNRNTSMSAPQIQSMVYTGTIYRGSLVLANSGGIVAECGADPASVTGVALEASATKPGWDAANSPTVITGRVTEVSVALANRNQIFSMRGKSAAGGDPLTPAQTHIGEQYGVVKVSNDWVLDIDETSAKVFTIVDIDIDNKIFFCKFLEAVISLT